MENLPASVMRVAEAARNLGLAIDIRIMTETTRTAEEAAQACGTTPAQIVKSLIFEGKESGGRCSFWCRGKIVSTRRR